MVASPAKPTIRMTSEDWWPVAGYEGRYSVSNLGNIRSEKRVVPGGNNSMRPVGGYLRSVQERDDDYHVVTLCKNRVKTPHRLHRVVAEAFIDNPHKKPHVNHKDGDKSNNRASNLEWVTRKENAEHASRLGLTAMGSQHYLAVLTEADIPVIRKRLAAGESQYAIASDYGVSRSTILCIKLGKSWKQVK